MDTTHTILPAHFREVHEDPFSTLHYSDALQTMLCTARLEYIPIEHFKSCFGRVTALSAMIPVKAFVFDKRNLRTFHQPSMEWYFAIWKQQVKKNGLRLHIKLLPELPWFSKAVEAGKAEIARKYGENLLEGIEILYLADIAASLSELNRRFAAS